MLIFNQEENIIKLQCFWGEIGGIYLPVIWRIDFCKHKQAVNFLNLYRDWKYYRYCLGTNNIEMIEHSIQYMKENKYMYEEYDSLFKERYPELFKDIKELMG